jgi:hypothetical protein
MKKLIFIFIYSLCLLNVANAQEDSRKNREEWLCMEYKFENSKIRCNKDSVLKLGRLINYIYETDKKITLANLRILKRDDLTVVDDENKIADFDILAPVKQPKLKDDKDIRFDKRPYSMLVKCNGHDVIIHADKAVGTYGKSYCRNFTISFPMNVVADTLNGHNVTKILVTYDYLNADTIFNDVNNVVKSIVKKRSEGADSTFTDDEQSIVLYCGDSPVALYNKAWEMNEKNQRLDANVLFKTADRIVSEGMFSGRYNISEENMNFASEIKYCIGFNLVETNIGGAFRYLNSANNIIYPNVSPKAYIELVNCLVNSTSALGLVYIENMLEQYGSNPKKFDNNEKKALYLFLLRRKGYCLIERQNYKEAKAMFNKVLSYNKDDQMAKSELKYIDECEKKIKEDKKKK